MVSFFATAVSCLAAFASWGLYRSFTGFDTTIISHHKTVQIPNPNQKKKDSNETSHAPSLSLLDLVKLKCPALFTKFYPTFWLPEGHLQTLWCAMGKFDQHFHIDYNRLENSVRFTNSVELKCFQESY
jgi:hypothetical protein